MRAERRMDARPGRASVLIAPVYRCGSCPFGRLRDRHRPLSLSKRPEGQISESSRSLAATSSFDGSTWWVASGDVRAARDLLGDIGRSGLGDEVDVGVLDAELVELLLGADAVAAPVGAEHGDRVPDGFRHASRICASRWGRADRDLEDPDWPNIGVSVRWLIRGDGTEARVRGERLGVAVWLGAHTPPRVAKAARSFLGVQAPLS